MPFRQFFSFSQFQIFIFAFTFLSQFGKMSTEPTRMQKAFTDDGIVPDVLAEAPARLAEAKVTFDGGLKVELGNNLKPEQTKKAPSVSWDADDESKYAIVIVDPDAPSRKHPTNRAWLHWLVVNVPGDQIAKGKTLTAYAGPTPPKGSGPHRYVILVYHQRNGSAVPDSAKPDSRAKFNIGEFAHKYGLGQPIAGNYFLAENK